ncbi:MAG: tRNA (adenosine(37)-N6)-threonylcarbamoyltransferase complex transferase subunit TsaD [Bacilli bacterium]|nr:tRNA (adenosine(37)-N6)-threonylcarbamoyltransferase complex transferase subunit TsaD [Bacilli bacterium]MDE6141796.1 tRNA (adenosine(37)-N6)-threonylcarbamoyltransferase complex transferase subunit TsaD [Bacilli bacterium]
MKDVYIMGIESSCDETSISIVKNGCVEIATTVLTQMDTHALYGGVVPEIASRMHTENITMVLEDVLSKTDITMKEIDAIAVTYAPGLLGSLLVGVEFAKTLALVYDKPLIATHHIAGHIYANNLVKPLVFPLLALVVSGGHTELVLMKGDYEFEVLGTTKDDAIGESFDKVARVLDLPYPGGPNVEKYSKEGNHTYELPKPMDNDELNFSFSGLKSAVINLKHNEEQRGNEIRKKDLARSFQDVAFDQVIRKTRLAIERFDVKRVIVAGGVSASADLRERMAKLCDELKVDLSIPPMRYCTDNATMIACAAYPQFLNNDFADLSLRAKSQEYFFQNND